MSEADDDDAYLALAARTSVASTAFRPASNR